MFDFGDTLALLIGLIASIIVILACLGAYTRKKAYLTPLLDQLVALRERLGLYFLRCCLLNICIKLKYIT
ncbi:unnamed protein product [Callosobruchus maculatus]|uniref:Uncharacterized protein n=1 Tax=Callosobruchus maculatus TaxID=64391 RepID=A0A653DAZ0_CALMS|nr:unnamed protein product [Callosobruchus maculatus]